MEIFVITVCVVFLIAVTAMFLAAIDPSKRKRSSSAQRTRTARAASAASGYEEEDRAFETALFKAVGPQNFVKHFYTKVVGITRKNEDGKVRETLLSNCQQFDNVNLAPEPNNPVDPNAVAVCLGDGQRLGYLNWRTAEEISRDMKQGLVWGAFVKYVKLPRKSRNGCLVLCMMQMTDEWVKKQEAKYAGRPT